MRPERWRQIEDLYHAALKLEPGGRSAYLFGACAGDLELKAEVESLLGCDDSATHFIDRVALDEQQELWLKIEQGKWWDSRSAATGCSLSSARAEWVRFTWPRTPGSGAKWQ